MIRRLQLLLWTIRYLSVAQVWYRLKRVARRPFWRRRTPSSLPAAKLSLAASQPLLIGVPDVAAPGPWAGDVTAAIARAGEISKKRFSFLDHPAEFHGDPGWNDERLSQLWRYQLHCFEYVSDLLVWSAAGQPAPAYAAFRELATSWMTRNALRDGDGWHPYTVSLRIVSWLHAREGFAPQLRDDPSFRDAFLTSLYGQARALAQDLELDVRGNHVIKNLKALLFAGSTFQGAEPGRWFDRGSDLLRRELDEQVPADGGHFERAPGYHLIVLRDCLEISIFLKRNRGASFEWLDHTIRRMLDYLVAVLAPDGEVPLLKDTVWEIRPQDLLAVGAICLDDPSYKLTPDFGLYPLLLCGQSGWQKFQAWPLRSTEGRSVALEDTGHFVMQNASRSEYLIADVGRPCPDYLPAHAHADMLSYELLVDGRRIVVDSGVYEYAAGPWRDYFRSTRAHNTVEVSGANQSEVWASFRVARRARPTPAAWQAGPDWALAQGGHDGYLRLPAPVLHRRTILWLANRFWLIVDELSGSDSGTAASCVHFHPDVSPQNVAGFVWRIDGGPAPLWLTAFGHDRSRTSAGQMEPERQGWYSERFGSVAPNTVLTMTADSGLPSCAGYALSRREPVRIESARSADGDGHTITVHHEHHAYLVQVPKSGPPVCQR
jgi:uncharacterized heparinase superfamily protein